jgi:hypothetical protein
VADYHADDPALAAYQRPVPSDRSARNRHQYIALSGDRRKSLGDNDMVKDHCSLAHTLPTSLSADLAEVGERWQSLTPEIRAEVLAVIRSVETPNRNTGGGSQ